MHQWILTKSSSFLPNQKKKNIHLTGVKIDNVKKGSIIWIDLKESLSPLAWLYLAFLSYIPIFGSFWSFHDGGRYHVETSPLICRANQWTGFYMITVPIMKELIILGLWPHPITSKRGERYVHSLFYVIR